MSASAESEQPPLSLDEYIALCANLHNTLLAKSFLPNAPPPKTSTDLLQRYESFRSNGPFDTYNPYIPPSLDPASPIFSLLTQLETTIPPPMGNGPPLTPLLYQPTPQWFFPALYSNEVNEAGSPFILLYPQRLVSQSPEDGGLFVDIYDLRGIWLSNPPGPGNLTPSEEWLPLDYLLKQELSRWGSGRYIHDTTSQDGLKIQKWVPVPSNVATTTPLPNLQVAEAISAWERLLHAIESRLPASMIPPANNATADSLPREALQNLQISTFAQHFLTHARRPRSWTFIAPGISTFTEASLHSAYATEPTTAFRRTLETSSEGSDWVTLLLPSVAVTTTTAPNHAGTTLVHLPLRVPTDVSQHPDDGINAFDAPHGFGNLAVDRRAGLYTAWADERDGDLVQLLEGRAPSSEEENKHLNYDYTPNVGAPQDSLGTEGYTWLSDQ
ncbi:predicted protein [Chaetomium globosum CBS 148.51]|uniref:Uncharacterized protein n=1 Tax=Chaetomium globosum (strain ATCC 6205 / CBS 148.51 / DSM 1962 / NBRC 6347 / NRRL 1970) TaxID=306901 RepID=Q2GTY9_CHAGB|nr:uncharacterized protein CHGG_08565 [Chaetomium globosum CBS 148.51]EAQ84551.1 predicted protein [Chaetomium globosum CBS 148.51]